MKGMGELKRTSWRKGTRAYAVELCQDIFAHWHVIYRWGRFGSSGGQAKDTDFPGYAEAVASYDNECRRRERRGYRRTG